MNNKEKYKTVLSQLITLYLLVVSFVSHASDKELSLKSLEILKNDIRGKKSVVVLWSLECPPCFKELETISQLTQQNKKLSLILINTDDASEYSKERQQVLMKYKLNRLTSFYFQNEKKEQLKYKIDPNWFGELPRSYFVSADGLWQGRSGVIEENHLKRWFL